MTFISRTLVVVSLSKAIPLLFMLFFSWTTVLSASLIEKPNEKVAKADYREVCDSVETYTNACDRIVLNSRRSIICTVTLVGTSKVQYTICGSNKSKKRYQKLSRVRHIEYGTGEIVSYNSDFGDNQTYTKDKTGEDMILKGISMAVKLGVVIVLAIVFVIAIILPIAFIWALLSG